MNKIRQLRKERGLSITKLAEAIGVSYQSLRKYEVGERNPPITVLIALADYLDTTVDYLVGREPKNKVKAEDGWYYYTINDHRLSQPMWVCNEDSEDDYVQVLSDYELKMLGECLFLGETLAEQLDYLHEKYIMHGIGQRSYEKITRVMIECEFYVKARRPVNVDS